VNPAERKGQVSVRGWPEPWCAPFGFVVSDDSKQTPGVPMAHIFLPQDFPPLCGFSWSKSSKRKYIQLIFISMIKFSAGDLS